MLAMEVPVVVERDFEPCEIAIVGRNATVGFATKFNIFIRTKATTDIFYKEKKVCPLIKEGFYLNLNEILRGFKKR